MLSMPVGWRYIDCKINVRLTERGQLEFPELGIHGYNNNYAHGYEFC